MVDEPHKIKFAGKVWPEPKEYASYQIAKDALRKMYADSEIQYGEYCHAEIVPAWQKNPEDMVFTAEDVKILKAMNVTLYPTVQQLQLQLGEGAD